jgi:small subunit ribosomal protein S19
MFDHIIVVHNGWEHLPIYITYHMVNHRLGNFTPTLKHSRKALPQRKKEKDQAKTFEWM